MTTETIRKAVEARRVTISAVWEGLDSETRQLSLQSAIADDPAVLPALRAQLGGLPGLRPATVQKWSAKECIINALRRRALNPMLMEAGLVQLHLQHRAAMLAAFLDRLGLPHENGLLTAGVSEGFASPEALGQAVDEISNAFPRNEIQTYVLTLLAVDPNVWDGLWSWLAKSTATVSA